MPPNRSGLIRTTSSPPWFFIKSQKTLRHRWRLEVFILLYLWGLPSLGFYVMRADPNIYPHQHLINSVPDLSYGNIVYIHKVWVRTFIHSYICWDFEFFHAFAKYYCITVYCYVVMRYNVIKIIELKKCTIIIVWWCVWLWVSWLSKSTIWLDFWFYGHNSSLFFI